MLNQNKAHNVELVLGPSFGTSILDLFFGIFLSTSLAPVFRPSFLIYVAFAQLSPRTSQAKPIQADAEMALTSHVCLVSRSLTFFRRLQTSLI